MKSQASFRVAFFGAACAVTFAILLGIAQIASQAPAAGSHLAQLA